MQKEFAKICDVKPMTLAAIIGKRGSPPGKHLCWRIEKETQGIVTTQELRGNYGLGLKMTPNSGSRTLYNKNKSLETALTETQEAGKANG